MSRGKSLVNIKGESLNKGSPIYDAKSQVSGLPKQRPSISITFMDVDRDFGLKYLVEKDKKHKGSRQILKEFDSFLRKARRYNSIEEFMHTFTPKERLNNADQKSKDKMNEIQKLYNIETADMVHIHCCGNGGGEMVLHGFVINNCFEVVWIDPDHEMHKC